MIEGSYPGGPRLVADIGGTNARFALEIAPGCVTAQQTLACTDHARFEDAARAYLDSVEASVSHAVIAIANPVAGDAIKMTNHDWAFSIDAARRELRLHTLLVVNDFTALAMALPALGPGDVIKIGGGQGRSGGVLGLVGAGTGLGVSGLVPAGDRWVPLQSEGGHVAFSPSDERELTVLRHAWRRYEHVSAERLVSGPGLTLIHEALAASRGISVAASTTSASIVECALEGSDALCRETLDCFCGMLGTVAANLAVTLGATGGIYIGGGVVPRFSSYFATSPFRARFEKKGRFSGFTAQIPTMLLIAPNPALLGAATILNEHLADKARVRAPATPAAPLPELDHARS